MSLKKHSILLPAAALAIASAALVAEEVPQAVQALAPTLQAWGTNPTLVAAVEERNAQGTGLDAIKKQDADWRTTTGVNGFMAGLMDNAAAVELKRLEASEPFFTELFLMDGQGANVAMTNKTSDYWQGDEAKFIEAYKGGQGAVHIGEVEFDNSAQAYLVQVSVPVMDGDRAVGALTVGVNLDEMERSGR
jgi:hypothetical protein